MNKTERAFHWIIKILQENNIQFRLSGGFAANLYGATRPLYDIDIEVSDDGVHELAKHVREYCIYGPERYRDETFDLLLMTLNYEGQEIDISGSDSDKLFNKEMGEWEPCGVDLNNVERKSVFGVSVPVIRKEELIAYKKKIRRDTDLEDVRQLET